MTISNFKLFQCWDEKRISQVINPEAASVMPADFMATHAPFTHIKYETHPSQVSDTSETGLLNELNEYAVNEEDGHAFVVIQGIPGTGKSHLIWWLKERYAQQNSERDEVLFIRRAQGNLRSTLQQIIESGIFDDATMQDHLKKLKNATVKLSNAALEDMILNNLQVATNEVKLPEAVSPRERRIKGDIEGFLLDPQVRFELKKPNGPVKRLLRFLSSDLQHSLANQEFPRFEAGDFTFQGLTADKIKQSNFEAARLVTQLKASEEMRKDLTVFLNQRQLIDFAIGRTINLTGTELKDMFGELRRELYRRNRNLAIFIEDVAALTGVDAELMEVLLERHTNQVGLCRIISVIGITDSYFRDRLPDNVRRDRVTHHLKLNDDQSSTAESDLLKDGDAIIDLAARYLNAMRKDRTEFETWYNANYATPADLPNRCTTCPHQATCHANFGKAELETGAVGLYPFNRQALLTMYTQLDMNKSSRTPRALLRDVLYYVLQSHTPKLKERMFPPAPREVGSQFNPPSWPNLHYNTVDTQGGKDAERLKSLLLFWGNKDAYSVEINGERNLGGLSRPVFEAFGLPFIEGIPSDRKIVKPDPVLPTPKPDLKPLPPKPEPKPPLPIISPLVITPQIAVQRWLGGEKLRHYDTFARILLNIIRDYTDWEAHGVSRNLLDERFKGYSRLVFEGQDSKVSSNPDDYIEFKRSQELGLVLSVVADIADKDSDWQQVPGKVGAYMAILSGWLRKEEARIVDFVQRPGKNIPAPLPLAKLLMLDCVFQDAVEGRLSSEQASPEVLFKTVMANCAAARDNKLPPSKMNSEVHSAQWRSLFKGLGNQATSLRTALLTALNRAQGNSPNVLFVDAATGLDILRELKAKDWELGVLPNLKVSNVKVWSQSYDNYNSLQSSLYPVLVGERQNLEQSLHTLQNYLKGGTPETVFQTIRDMLKLFSAPPYQLPHNFNSRPDLQSSQLTELITKLAAVCVARSQEELLLGFSAAGVLLPEVQLYLNYLSSFSKLLQDVQQATERAIFDAQSQSNAGQIAEIVGRNYDETIQSLQSLLSKEAVSV
jgi:hypothetical protein